MEVAQVLTVRVYAVLNNIHIDVTGTEPFTTADRSLARVRELCQAVIEIDRCQGGQEVIEQVNKVLKQLDGYAGDVGHYSFL